MLLLSIFLQVFKYENKWYVVFNFHFNRILKSHFITNSPKNSLFCDLNTILVSVDYYSWKFWTHKFITLTFAPVHLFCFGYTHSSRVLLSNWWVLVNGTFRCIPEELINCILNCRNMFSHQHFWTNFPNYLFALER